ncbi:hypothetical protein [Ferrovum sp.]|uniref:hypothetical protein n=1 Tax=Ferrovum sp. TaxID=2609467 RepID=UPI00260D84D8|nr:hypothetical protein [Ferrovum sp.]
MSVKKMGTKLAQGVHQVKVRQDEVPLGVEPVNPVAQAEPVREAVKPVPAKAGNRVLHPNRIWPD